MTEVQNMPVDPFLPPRPVRITQPMSRRVEVQVRWFDPLTPTIMQAPSKSIELARRKIEQQGWTQNALSDEEGQLCSVGALILDNDDVSVKALKFLAEAMGLGSQWKKIDDWNDTPGRTKEEVLAAFQKAEELALEAGE